ncbi:unnamed protein product [Ostreobium quekettii]|uniref:CBM1 domain-containing protein n=1 Tax=Ostreobium quekettii TaxID=121088 RepID=A0A8S1IUR5_9CHLO|nr:unnamed protein product [Ostreobium quekettii]|eukprot:evm.model.scf_147.5 EVM.evm.TU.scf_147.5   scf_147:51757-53141(+)
MRPSAPVICLALLCLGRSSLAIDPSWYNAATTFSGIATFYGLGSHSGGHCVLRNPFPAYYDNLTPLAINAPMYDGSVTCGMCMRVWGEGVGIGTTPVIGPFMAYVADECPECHYGDLDLAADGDGRWEIQWEAVPCPDGPITFYFEGSNPFFLKVQPRGMKTPATRVTVGGQAGVRTPDNFFEVRNGAGFSFPVEITVETVLGCEYRAQLGGFGNNGFGEERPEGLLNYVCNGPGGGDLSPPEQVVLPEPFQEVQQGLTSTGDQGGCSGLYGQCGGINYSGATCCSEGGCTELNAYYSQCL